jgi:predicted RNA methylase
MQAIPAAGGIKGKLVVDVGSRMGCVVFAAVVLGGAGESIGIEINEEFCALERQAFKELGVAGKAKVVCGDVCGKTLRICFCIVQCIIL